MAQRCFGVWQPRGTEWEWSIPAVDGRGHVRRKLVAGGERRAKESKSGSEAALYIAAISADRRCSLGHAGHRLDSGRDHVNGFACSVPRGCGKISRNGKPRGSHVIRNGAGSGMKQGLTTWVVGTARRSGYATWHRQRREGNLWDKDHLSLYPRVYYLRVVSCSMGAGGQHRFLRPVARAVSMSPSSESSRAFGGVYRNDKTNHNLLNLRQIKMASTWMDNGLISEEASFKSFLTVGDLSSILGPLLVVVIASLAVGYVVGLAKANETVRSAVRERDGQDTGGEDAERFFSDLSSAVGSNPDLNSNSKSSNAEREQEPEPESESEPVPSSERSESVRKRRRRRERISLASAKPEQQQQQQKMREEEDEEEEEEEEAGLQEKEEEEKEEMKVVSVSTTGDDAWAVVLKKLRAVRSGNRGENNRLTFKTQRSGVRSTGGVRPWGSATGSAAAGEAASRVPCSPDLSLQVLMAEPRRELLEMVLKALQAEFRTSPGRNDRVFYNDEDDDTWNARCIRKFCSVLVKVRRSWLAEDFSSDGQGVRSRSSDRDAIDQNLTEEKDPADRGSESPKSVLRNADGETEGEDDEGDGKSIFSWLRSMTIGFLKNDDTASGGGKRAGTSEIGEDVDATDKNGFQGTRTKGGGSEEKEMVGDEKIRGGEAKWGSSSSQYDSLLEEELTKNEKIDLYCDLMYFLQPNKPRRSGSGHIPEHILQYSGSVILEDLVTSLAELIAAEYLQRTSFLGEGVDDEIDDERYWPARVVASLRNTRAMERIRNEIALRAWLRHNLGSVTAMYEDRYELWTFNRVIKKRRNGEKGRNKTYWRRSSALAYRTTQNRNVKVLGKSKDGSNEEWKGNIDITQEEDGDGGGRDDLVEDEVVLLKCQMSARRSKQLRALEGWRLGYSIYLEFADVAVPILSALIVKIGNVISYLLVTLIGRSLGLIYRGVMQSLRR